MYRSTCLAILLCAPSLLTSAMANAATIDFEDQPAGSSTFGAAPQFPTYTFGTETVLFEGGAILTNEVGGSDATNVFATASKNFGGAGIDLMAINLSQPIQTISFDIVNALPGVYQIGNGNQPSIFITIAPGDDTAHVDGFQAGKGGVFVNDPSASNGDFSFAIDNITFEQVAAVPESSTWTMLLIGFAGIGFFTYRRHQFTKPAGGVPT
jgi:hypothetical protein